MLIHDINVETNVEAVTILAGSNGAGKTTIAELFFKYIFDPITVNPFVIVVERESAAGETFHEIRFLIKALGNTKKQYTLNKMDVGESQIINLAKLNKIMDPVFPEGYQEDFKMFYFSPYANPMHLLVNYHGNGFYDYSTTEKIKIDHEYYYNKKTGNELKTEAWAGYLFSEMERSVRFFHDCDYPADEIFKDLPVPRGLTFTLNLYDLFKHDFFENTVNPLSYKKKELAEQLERIYKVSGDLSSACREIKKN